MKIMSFNDLAHFRALCQRSVKTSQDLREITEEIIQNNAVCESQEACALFLDAIKAHQQYFIHQLKVADEGIRNISDILYKKQQEIQGNEK